MKKALFLSVLALAFVGVVLCFLLATKVGTRLMRPLFEGYMQEHFDKDIQLKNFRFGLGVLEANLGYKDFLDLKLKGGYSLLLPKFDLNVEGKSKFIRSAFKIEGRLAGDFGGMIVNLSSNIASSKSNLVAEMDYSHVKRMFVEVKKMDLEQMASFFGGYLNGKMDLELLIDTREGARQGEFNLTTQGLYVSRKLGHLSFVNALLKSKAQGEFHGILEGDGRFLVWGDLEAPAYELRIKEGRVNLANLELDYELKIPSVKKISPTARKDFGILASGKVQGGKMQGGGKAGRVLNGEDLEVSLQTQSLGGQVSAELGGGQVGVEFARARADRVLTLLNIPQSFSAELFGRLDYDMSVHQGRLAGEMQNLLIRRNKFFDLIAQYTKFDIQKERFAPVPLDIKLDDAIADISNLEVNGKHIGITSEKIMLNLERMHIDAPFALRVQESSINFRLVGLSSAPQLEFKLNDILRLDKKKLLDNPNVQKGIRRLLDRLL